MYFITFFPFLGISNSHKFVSVGGVILQKQYIDKLTIILMIHLIIQDFFFSLSWIIEHTRLLGSVTLQKHYIGKHNNAYSASYNTDLFPFLPMRTHYRSSKHNIRIETREDG